MPKPRKPLRATYTPPSRTGWYGYQHAGNNPEAIYLDEDGLTNAQSRFQTAIALNIPPADIWSTRKLKKRERGGLPLRPRKYLVL